MTNPYESSPQVAQPPPAPPVPRGVRACATLLIVGGVSLLVTMIWLWWASEGNLVSTILAGVSLLIGTTFSYTGLQLWRGQDWAIRFGMILFLLQIPVISSDPITYLAISGFGLMLSFSSTADFNVGFQFGGNFRIWFGSGAEGWTVGVNIVAAIAARYLFEYFRRMRRYPVEPSETVS